MPDIALVSVKNAGGYPVFDVELTSKPASAGTVARDVEMDSGLTTAVYMSLFTDARASIDEVSDPTDLRGWWGDEFGSFGSKLWLLLRAKATDESLANAKTYTEDALAWLVEDGIAKSVSATVERLGLYAISILVQISRPDNTSSTLRYALNWAAIGG